MNHEDHDHEDHEDCEDHEGKEGGTNSVTKWKMRLSSPLSPEAERVMTETIGSAIAVHRELGHGYLESIYRKAMYIELAARGLDYERERKVAVNYRGVSIPGQRVDLIVAGLIVVELKAVVRLDNVHRSQLISYLRTTGLRGGLLINFRVPVLQQGLRRVVV